MQISDTENSINDSDQVTENEVDSFLQRELLAASEGNNADLNSVYTPQIGQEFKTRDDAHHFFNFYTFLAVTHVVRTTSRKRNKEIIRQEMKCSKHGKQAAVKEVGEEQEQVEQQQSSTTREGRRNTSVEVKTDCGVVMVVREKNGIWRVIRLNLDHNHCLSPRSRN